MTKLLIALLGAATIHSNKESPTSIALGTMLIGVALNSALNQKVGT